MTCLHPALDQKSLYINSHDVFDLNSVIFETIPLLPVFNSNSVALHPDLPTGLFCCCLQLLFHFGATIDPES